MAGIGGLTFTTMIGDIQGDRPEVRVRVRAGVAGHGLAVSASRGVPQEIETQLQASLANCLAQLGAAEGMVGTVQSITDPNGVTYSNCSILDVRGTTQRFLGGTGGATHLLRMRWLFMAEP